MSDSLRKVQAVRAGLSMMPACVFGFRLSAFSLLSSFTMR